MKKDEEKEIDNIFKKGLEDPDGNHGHMENDWGAMEQMLDKRKKSPFIIYWLPILSTAAALLLLLIGLWLYKPANSPHPRLEQAAVVKHVGNQHVTNNTPAAVSDTLAPKTVNTHNIANNKLNTTQDILAPNAIKKQNIASTTKGNNLKNVNTTNNSINKNQIANQPNNNAFGITGNTRQAVKQGNDSSNKNNSTVINSSQKIANNTIKTDDNPPAVKGIVQLVNVKKGKIRPSLAYRPQFAISVLASTDKNGVNSFQQAKGGDNAGVLFSFGLTRKLTISTGAIYSAKQYMTDFASYHTSYQFATNPVSVLADCKMFDVPLNIDYNVYNKHRNKFSIGTGISSYLMLHENYRFNYAPYASGPAKYNVPNPDKYLFSIMNIQATYTRQINSKFGLAVQPYMKLPLSAVGASEVHLQSTGVAVGFTWNLSSLSKP